MTLFRKFFFTTFIFLFTFSCAEYKIDKSNEKIEKKYYSSSGFALIYDENLKEQGLINKKFRNNENLIIHAILKKNTPVLISNPINSKNFLTKVSGKAIFPPIFNVVIAKEIAEFLELDLENPFVEIIEVKKNKTFVAKKGITYDEEKNVATTAPIKKIEIDNLTTKTISKKIKPLKYNFILIISDFYFLESANNLKNELNTKTQLTNLSVQKINDKKYRLYAGPFQNFNSLKLTYISLNKIGFSNLNIIKNND